LRQETDSPVKVLVVLLMQACSGLQDGSVYTPKGGTSTNNSLVRIENGNFFVVVHSLLREPVFFS